MFNFGKLASAKPVNTTAYLKPYTINENVVIKGTEVKEGTTKDGNPWKALKITFGNDEGIYNEMIFYPNEKDPKFSTRPEYDTSNGGKRLGPAPCELFQDELAAIGFAFNPEGFQKLQSILGKLKTVNDLMTAFKQILDKVIDKNPTSMKLVGRNSNGTVYATFPRFTNCAQANTEKKAADNNVELNEWYTWSSTPFGDNLSFTAYEMQQAEKIKSAKPTPMADDPLQVDSSDEDIDLATLL